MDSPVVDANFRSLTSLPNCAGSLVVSTEGKVHKSQGDLKSLNAATSLPTLVRVAQRLVRSLGKPAADEEERVESVTVSYTKHQYSIVPKDDHIYVVKQHR
ncbi:hypothetical protein IWQ60_005115 [Tieghemiomyces parasiticus]|uniref:Uncharacterized protein n=1 Tax=Tieghemiomyces parasiticus TaxID=78921 RepID=A0A9W8DZ57_9FUNG|nr:hypothetical protein IWQ60_005115 [Tieghemiomyces parasiticus]